MKARLESLNPYYYDGRQKNTKRSTGERTSAFI